MLHARDRVKQHDAPFLVSEACQRTLQQRALIGVQTAFLREFAVSGMRLVAVEQGRVIAAAWSGKIKTASTMVCLCLMLVFQSNLLNVVCIAVIVATTVYSGIEYFAKNLDVFKEAD